MNFDDAIAAHIIWKVRLGLYMEGLEPLDAATVCKDNVCALGQWLYGDGRRFRTAEGFEPLRASHAEFHRAAAEVIRLAERGGHASEAAMLGPGTPFYDLSLTTVKRLIDLRDLIQHAA